MSTTFTRARKHRLAAVQQRVNKITQGDALFFQRFPHRRHRIRHASPAELEQNALVTGIADPSPPEGRRYFVAVRQVAPGIRMRLFAQSFEDADVDMSEVEAKQVFDFVSDSHDKANAIESQLRTVMAKRGGR